MAKKSSSPKFSDAPQKAGLLTRQCPDCGKYHHPRAGSCPNCGHTYKKTRSGRKKIVKRKVTTKKTVAANRPEPLDAGIQFVAACRGDVKEARRMLDKIESIQKL